MTQEIEKLNNANNMTDNAFTSLKALSVGMQTKLAVLKENAEVNQIFSRYKLSFKETIKVFYITSVLEALIILNTKLSALKIKLRG